MESSITPSNAGVIARALGCFVDTRVDAQRLPALRSYGALEAFSQ